MTKGFSQCHIFSVLYTFCCFSFYLAFFVRVCDLVKNNGKKSSFKHLQESQYNIWFKSTIVNITVLSKDSWCEVWEASWPRIQNVYLMISKPLSYHKTKDILEDHQSEDFFMLVFESNSDNLGTVIKQEDHHLGPRNWQTEGSTL